MLGNDQNVGRLVVFWLDNGMPGEGNIGGWLLDNGGLEDCEHSGFQESLSIKQAPTISLLLTVTALYQGCFYRV